MFGILRAAPSLRVREPLWSVDSALDVGSAKLLSDALNEKEPFGPAHRALLAASKDPVASFLVARKSRGSPELIMNGVMPTAEWLRKHGRREEAEAFAQTWALFNSLFVEPQSEEDITAP